jgi:hypothetical protein
MSHPFDTTLLGIEPSKKENTNLAAPHDCSAPAATPQAVDLPDGEFYGLGQPQSQKSRRKKAPIAGGAWSNIRT